MKARTSFPIVIAVTCLVCLARASQPAGFPYVLPDKKPNRPLSVAMERLYRDYLAPTPESNELYSTFKFTPLEGLDYHNGDGTISRRDPSKVIRVTGTYYVWYTHRATATPPRGAALGNDTVPSTDWDLAEIWYATSDDGFTWQERGVAIVRPPKPHPGWRSVSTADILFWKGKYYLYYQGFLEMSGKRGDDCPVTASVADSPDGPWRPCNKIVIPNGAPGEWDQYSIHDPYPLVYKGKIYLYYKSDFNNAQPHVRAHGLATADDPLGPFMKHPLNPILNSGHETTLFPFMEGIAAFAIHNGIEHNTIQYAPDGISFKIAAVSSLMPVAAGPYVPDAFTDTKDGRGITWGLCHITGVGTPETRHSILARFDCDLSRDAHDPRMKQTDLYLKPEAYFSQGLGQLQRQQRARAASQKQEPKVSIPRIAGDYVNVYRPGGEIFPGPNAATLVAGRFYEDWVPNDHCFVRDESERWHAFGITHPLTDVSNVHAGECLLFHAVASPGSLKETLKEGSWKDLRKVLPPSERPQEMPAIHAPWILKRNGLYHMVYGPTPIRYAVSSDLTDWIPKGILMGAPSGRDPHIFVWNDTYYLIVCGVHEVRIATSRDFRTWTEHGPILQMKQGIDPESPSVVRCNDTFYLFVCGWNGEWDRKDIQGAYQHKTYVFQSDDPLQFEIENQVAVLDAHAPEVFQDEAGDWFISSAEWPHRGVSIARLVWE